jgi:hypothetical protein
MTTFCNDPDFLKRKGKREGERNRPPTDPDDETLFAGIKSFAAITAQPRTSSPGTSPACCHRKTDRTSRSAHPAARKAGTSNTPATSWPAARIS